MHARRYLGAALAALALLSVNTAADARRARDVVEPAAVTADERFPVQRAMMSASDVTRAKRCAPPFGCKRDKRRAVTGFGDLAERAGAYLGRNPTGWARAWCGKFLRMIVPSDPAEAFNVARNWSRYGSPSGSAPGEIGVMLRHVGIVIGRCADGSIHLRSGNHATRVGDGCSVASRFIAFHSA